MKLHSAADGGGGGGGGGAAAAAAAAARLGFLMCPADTWSQLGLLLRVYVQLKRKALIQQCFAHEIVSCCQIKVELMNIELIDMSNLPGSWIMPTDLDSCLRSCRIKALSLSL